MSAQYLTVVIRYLLVCLWLPASAWAASVTLTATLSGVSGLTFGLVAALSSLSGATALLMRIEQEIARSSTGVLPRPWLFASMHMCGSWLAGVLAFFVSEGQDLNDWAELGVIIIASFLGAKFIELMGERYLSRLDKLKD